MKDRKTLINDSSVHYFGVKASVKHGMSCLVSPPYAKVFSCHSILVGIGFFKSTQVIMLRIVTKENVIDFI